MAKSDSLTLRIEHDLKEKGNSILNELGITPSGFVNMAYSQLVQQRGLPFEVKLNKEQPDLAMSREDFDAMIRQCDNDIANGNCVELDEAFNKLDEKYGLTHEEL